MHWDALLKEVLSKKTGSTALTAYPPLSEPDQITSHESKRENKKIFLGLEHKNVYFTNREAQVMVQLLLGKTINAAAEILDLSPRTIEFYVKNMKAKLSCRTKSELIGKVFTSDFIRKVNFMASLESEEI